MTSNDLSQVIQLENIVKSLVSKSCTPRTAHLAFEGKDYLSSSGLVPIRPLKASFPEERATIHTQRNDSTSMLPFQVFWIFCYIFPSVSHPHLLSTFQI